MAAERILFLEDNENIREVLAEYLRREGYEVLEVSDGLKAYETIRVGHFDLAIFDIMVPSLSGLDLLKRLKAEGISLPIIMLSALGDELTQYQSFDLFADDYIVKPVSPLLLLKRVEAVLRRSQKSMSTPDSGFRLLEESYEVFVKGQKFELTITEFLLVQALYREQGRVFTREQLISKVYWDEYLGSDRVIDAHVKNIRRKLPANPIKTVIGAGYQFQNPELEA